MTASARAVRPPLLTAAFIGFAVLLSGASAFASVGEVADGGDVVAASKRPILNRDPNALAPLPPVRPGAAAKAPTAGMQGGPGLAVKARKILTAEWQGRSVVNNGVVLVKDGLIEAVGPASEVEIPSNYEVKDLGSDWLMPGIIELHCHIAGAFGLNDMVYLTNPGLRASSDVTPGSELLRRGMAAGVTTVLYIPGSGTNIGGQGILLRSGFDTFERAEIRSPGSMKLAQAGNPERWMIRPNRTFMNWNTRNTLRRGKAYAGKWTEYEKSGGEKPEIDPQFEVFRALMASMAQISTHTQIYQVALKTITDVHDELGIPVFIDHGTFDTWRLGKLIEEREIFAIVGPRAIDVPTRGFINWSGSNPERIQGCVAGYQELGVTRIGFNTDSPVIPQEELQLQAAMGVRYGFDNSKMDAVRGLTIVPAMACGLDESIGSIEVGKIADLLWITGDPADPRSFVKEVWQSGEPVYDISEEKRLW